MVWPRCWLAERKQQISARYDELERRTVDEQGVPREQMCVNGRVRHGLREGGPDRLVQPQDVDYFACTPLVERGTH